MGTDRSFEAPSAQNLIKSRIVGKYFKAWSQIVLARSGDPRGRIAYIDLFAGPGKFNDGTLSTPFQVLGEAIEDRQLCTHLTTFFSDQNQSHVTQLQESIDGFPGIEKLTYKPQVSQLSVGAEVTTLFRSLFHVPTLFFIDPWGYKGLSIDLIGSVIRGWGCDCIFFFNYNRINSALGNAIVDPRINDLFGLERAENLRQKVRGKSPDERQTVIINELTEALRDVGGEYVLPFEFESKHGERPSHYITFVSKSKRGYLLMKDIMFSLSSDDTEVRRLGYVPVRSPQLRMNLGVNHPYSIPALKSYLLEICAGKKLTVSQVYEDYTIGTPYILRHVREALRQLEAESLVVVHLPADRRPKKKGVVTLAKHHTVTFPH